MISDRKLEHLLICKNYDVNYKDKTTGFEDIELIHRALPEVHKEEIDISTEVFGKKLESPLFITAITGGHVAAKDINKELATVAEEKQIGLGVGSQRAAIVNPELRDTYDVVREYAPSALVLGNIGAPQSDLAEKAVEILDSDILAIHLNPLQEAIQPEGDVDARGYIDSIAEICKTIDIEGAGGTSWAAVETYRADDRYLGELFWDWGIPTAVSTAEVVNSVDIPVVSSGGIRSGLDAAKAIALGADAVGMALPALKGAYEGQDALVQMVERFNESLRIAMFLVGASNIEELKNSNLIIKGETKNWLEARGFDTKAYARR